ncbi:conjugal transfer protein TraF [Burkholderia vietnamiensis]|uniref:conjugal transfer protein TraF n=1 Tax=Burkholderia vietnamiensis TaxID=60552 RepID=UPI0009BC282A|nr:conjugal transfer protein TraF [Burkholderia vietnamiensis]MBR8189157.1 conjugal transfer protein TraF [Burkholderia vietnamiensis]HDR9174364.1 conjugal transfer protein TraF [Burkholderia vietnamiensis]
MTIRFWKRATSVAVSGAILCAAVSAAPRMALAQQAQDDGATQDYWASSIWSNPDRGFQWYPPDQLPPKPSQRQAEEPPPAPRIDQITDAEQFRKELLRLKDVAVMTPTPENVYNYYFAQRVALDKASRFSAVAKQVVWTHPEIDENARSSMASYAFNQVELKNAQLTKQWVADVAKQYGLVFFFRGDCEYCHLTAPAVIALQRKYGFEVLAITMDGGSLQGFPGAKPDNGISQVVSNGEGVNYFPSIYLVARDSNRSILLGAGGMTVEDIEKRIVYLTRGGQAYQNAYLNQQE